MILVLAAVAGGFGAAARFLVDSAVNRRNRLTFPLGTVVVNVSACFLLGLLTGWTIAHPDAAHVRTVLGTGFLGGYSTFSTASVEGWRLLQQGRRTPALAHAGGMLVLSLGAAALGIVLAGG